MTQYIEDYIATLLQYPNSTKLHDYDHKPTEFNRYEFLNSIHKRIHSGRSLTTRQAETAIRTLKSLSNLSFDNIDMKEMLRDIDNNNWRTTIVASIEKKNEARYIGDNVIALSFIQTYKLKPLIKHLKGRWIDGFLLVTVTSKNIDNLIAVLGTGRFNIDDTTENYLALCLDSKAKISQIVKHQDMVVINTCNNKQLDHYLLKICGATII